MGAEGKIGGLVDARHQDRHGFAGLAPGACFANFIDLVVCVGNYPSMIERLYRGEIAFFEPKQDHLVAGGAQEGRAFGHYAGLKTDV